jgi:gamma-glutamyltranspeptidase/glutathione hydrolase
MAIVGWGDETVGYLGCGRSPQAITIEAVVASAGSSMPQFGPHTVTVPGAVRGWFDLLERFGTMSFGAVASSAVGLARGGFAVSAEAADVMKRSQARYTDRSWQAIYGGVSERTNLVQKAVAETLDMLASDGPDAYYRGPIASAIVDAVSSAGGTLSLVDLTAHDGAWVTPLSVPYRDSEVLELPPPTQGVALLEALRVLEAMGPLPQPGADRYHLMIEATKVALVDLGKYVTDPASMTMSAEDLLASSWIEERTRDIDMQRAGRPATRPESPGGTAYLAAADDAGMMVSLIQSNYADFGSGITVPDWGINLHNRGSEFVLDATDFSAVNILAPNKLPRHTLKPGLLRRAGRPWAAYGTRGGALQVSVGVQLVTGLVDDDLDPDVVVAAPRWVLNPGQWAVGLEASFDRVVGTALRDRGHLVIPVQPEVVGHAQVIRSTDAGYTAASDPRTEGAVEGIR